MKTYFIEAQTITRQQIKIEANNKRDAIRIAEEMQDSSKWEIIKIEPVHLVSIS